MYNGNAAIEIQDPPLLDKLLNGLNPKQKEFVTYGSNPGEKANVAFIGAPGAGKTTACIVRAMLLNIDAAQNNPAPIANRGFIGMWDKSWLYKTTITEFLTLLTDAGITYEPEKPRHEAMFTVPSMRFQVLWGQTDEPGRIVNANLGWGYIEQCEKGTPWESVRKLERRLRLSGVFHSIFINGNAFPKGHWLQDRWPEVGHTVFSSPLDNAEHLPEDFLKALEGMNEVEKAEYIDGTLSVLGQRFYPMASRGRHGPTGLTAAPDLPLVRAWDYGRQACLISQKQRNRMVCLKEWLGEFNEPLRGFKARVVAECREIWGERKFVDIQDPSGKNKDTTRSISAYEIMVSHPDALHPIDADNDQDKGHQIVRELMTSEEEGQPLIIADAGGCPMTLEGWVYGYIAKDRPEGLVPRPVPVDNIYTHFQDLVRYTACYLFRLYQRRTVEERVMGKVSMAGMVANRDEGWRQG